MTVTRKNLIFSHHAKQRAEERGLRLGGLFEQKIRNARRQQARDGRTQRVFTGDTRVFDESDDFVGLQTGEIVVVTRESERTIVVITAYRRNVSKNSLQSRQKRPEFDINSLAARDKAMTNRSARRNMNRELRLAA